MDLKEFSKKMQLRASKLEPNVNVVKQKVASAILRGVVEQTPVDTGAAISNWQVGLGQSTGSTVLPYAPGFKGSTHGDNVRATISAGDQSISNSKPGQVIHVANALDYIEQLDQGSSTQAPEGIVAVGVTRGLISLRAAKVITD